MQSKWTTYTTHMRSTSPRTTCRFTAFATCSAHRCGSYPRCSVRDGGDILRSDAHTQTPLLLLAYP